MRIPFETVLNMLLIVLHQATYELMANRRSIVTIDEVTQALLLFVITCSVTVQPCVLTVPSVLKPFRVVLSVASKSLFEVAS